MYRYALGSLATAGRVIGTKPPAVIKNRPMFWTNLMR